MKKLPLRDHRAVRAYLTKDDYGLYEGPEYQPKGVISKEAWRSLTILPDTVALETTDGFSYAIPVLQKMAQAWLDIHDGMPEGSPMRTQCLAAVFGFEGAVFNAVCGWYRIAGVALRCVVEDILVGLYYQNRRANWTDFEKAVSGKGHTPGRKIVNAELVKYAPKELLADVNAFYQGELSIYVHRTSEGELWNSNGPVFRPEHLNIWIRQYEKAFRLLCKLIDVVAPSSGAVRIADAIQF